MHEVYREGMKQQPPGWEDSPELEAELERLGGLSYYGRAAFDAEQRRVRERGFGPSFVVDKSRSLDSLPPLLWSTSTAQRKP